MQYVPERQKYRVGTRQSQLALIQTESVINQLNKFYPNIEFEVLKMKTIGDKNLMTPLANVGDKGLFTKELEVELEKKTIDFVVHSLKDVPSSSLPPNMVLGAILERADPRDAVVIAPWRTEKSLKELPENSVIGTSSTRRIAQLKLNYPKFKYKDIRGNMNTRWEKLSNQELGYDAMIVAVAGFQRLNWANRISEIIEPDRILYAIGQGALGIECRHNDNDTLRMLSVLNHEPTVVCCVAERAFLKRIEGGCSIPNAVRTIYDGKSLQIYGILLNLDGSRHVKSSTENSDLTISKTTPIPNFLVKHQNESNNLAISQPTDHISLYRHFAHVCAININETILENAEICGTNLAVQLMQMGAENILEEIRQKPSNMASS